MARLGYGLTPYGFAPYGLSLAGTNISISQAFAVDKRTVGVILTNDPLHQSVLGSGDAFNPATWSVVRNDSGFVFTIFEILYVGIAAVYLKLQEPLGQHLVDHTVESLTLKSAAGVAILPPTSADFDGLSERGQLLPGPSGDVDLKNSPPGVLEITAAGAYAIIFDEEVIKKTILRRVNASPGDFFWLPDFGVGLKVKSPVPGTELVKLRAELRRQILADPQVVDAQVSLALDSRGILQINILARTVDSRTLQLQLPAQT